MLMTRASVNIGSSRQCIFFLFRGGGGRYCSPLAPNFSRMLGYATPWLNKCRNKEANAVKKEKEKKVTRRAHGLCILQKRASGRELRYWPGTLTVPRHVMHSFCLHKEKYCILLLLINEYQVRVDGSDC